MTVINDSPNNLLSKFVKEQMSYVSMSDKYVQLAKMFHNDVYQRALFFSSVYLYDEVWRGDVSRQGGEVDSSLLMRRQLGIILIVQGNA